jgi:NAD+ synthase (glutamine-hydrolysing)
MRVALAQINTTVGAFAENARAVKERVRAAADAGASLVVFPELTLCGYPPRDFVTVRDFVDRQMAVLEQLARDPDLSRVTALVGFVEPHHGDGAGLYNACAVLAHGRVAAIARKSLLPTYDVFDEARYFDPAPDVSVVDVAGVRVGVSICEDLWNDKLFWDKPRYTNDPIDELDRLGAQILVNLSASPYALGKVARRREMTVAAARRHSFPIALCNLVGGNDSLIFDGHSIAVSASGDVLAQAPGFEEALTVVDLEPRAAARTARPRPAHAEPDLARKATAVVGPATVPAHPQALAVVSAYELDLSDASCAELASALTLGIRDYARKTGFRGAVLGLSGGIDSSLTAALAARALGPENVTGIAMPSRYTLGMSNEDARALADALGLQFHVIAIEPIFQAYLRALEPIFAGRKPDVTEENLQARIRGMLLMAYSNKTGALLLSTGNKSELATGFCTLYGDMAGGLAAIGDLSKTAVYALSRWLNRQGKPIIPDRVLTRPPTAELRENQTDQDTLPPYDDLDKVLRGHVEEHLGVRELTARGLSDDLVRRVLKLVVRSEYKRRQAAPVLRVTARAFGEGWRFPIAHAYQY